MSREELLELICPTDATNDYCIGEANYDCHTCEKTLVAWLDDYAKQIRADAIDECINFIKNHSTRAFIDSDGWGCSDYDREEIFKLFWLDDLEQLKEQKNECG